MKKVNYHESLGRAIIHTRSDWYVTLQVELSEAILMECGNRRDLALFNEAKEANDEGRMKELCAAVVGRLPWLDTVAAGGEKISAEDPVDALRRRTESDNCPAVAKGSMKGGKQGDGESQGKGKGKGKGRIKGKEDEGEGGERNHDYW